MPFPPVNSTKIPQFLFFLTITFYRDSILVKTEQMSNVFFFVNLFPIVVAFIILLTYTNKTRHFIKHLNIFIKQITL